MNSTFFLQPMLKKGKVLTSTKEFQLSSEVIVFIYIVWLPGLLQMATQTHPVSQGQRSNSVHDSHCNITIAVISFVHCSLQNSIVFACEYLLHFFMVIYRSSGPGIQYHITHVTIINGFLSCHACNWCTLAWFIKYMQGTFITQIFFQNSFIIIQII